MFDIVQALVPIAVAVVLPVLIVWIVFRAASNKDNKTPKSSSRQLKTIQQSTLTNSSML